MWGNSRLTAMHKLSALLDSHTHKSFLLRFSYSDVLNCIFEEEGAKFREKTKILTTWACKKTYFEQVKYTSIQVNIGRNFII